MKVISRELFNAMKAAGFISHDKFDKSYTITSIKKPSKRKKVYICEKALNDYLWSLKKPKYNNKGV